MKFLFIGMLLLVVASECLQAQRLAYVPFCAGKNGLMDTLGTETIAPGTVKDIEVLDGFSAYYITYEAEKENWLMDPVTGQKITEYGVLQSGNPLYWKRKQYYHFVKDGKSVLVNFHDHVSIPLTKEYWSFDANAALYDEVGVVSLSYIIGRSGRDNYDILMPDSMFKLALELSAVSKIEYVLHAVHGQAMGLLITRVEKEQPKPRPMAKPVKGAPQLVVPRPIVREKEVSYLLDRNLRKLGKVAHDEKAIAQKLGYEVYISSSAQMGVIVGPGSGMNERLNSEFEIAQDNKYDWDSPSWLLQQTSEGQKKLLSTKEVNFQFAKDGKGDYILEIWTKWSKDAGITRCYFDYNGVRFPKNKLMLPVKYYPFANDNMKPFLITQ